MNLASNLTSGKEQSIDDLVVDCAVEAQHGDWLLATVEQSMAQYEAATASGDDRRATACLRQVRELLAEADAANRRRSIALAATWRILRARQRASRPRCRSMRPQRIRTTRRRRSAASRGRPANDSDGGDGPARTAQSRADTCAPRELTAFVVGDGGATQ